MTTHKDFFQLVNEKVPVVATGKNKVYYAELKEYFNEDAFRNFSIKVPLRGDINYSTAQEVYNLRPGKFLLASKQPGEVSIGSNTTVKSLCIDIDQQTINEAFSVLYSKGRTDLDNLEAGHFFSPSFIENAYHLDNSELGIHLNELAKGIVNKDINITEETFLTLAENIVRHELNNYRSLNALKVTKLNTRKELLKRLLIAKDLIDSCFLSSPTIEIIAQECGMSIFYFYRSFKQAFNYTPHQYIIEKKMQFAMAMLLKKNRQIDIARLCGFPDMPTFCKAFKKRFGVSPAKFRIQKEDFTDV